MRRKTLIFLLLFVIVFVVAEVPRLRFTQGAAGDDSVAVDSVVVDSAVAPRSVADSSVVDSSLTDSQSVALQSTVDKNIPDTASMDSLQLLIWKRNKAIDDSLAADSANRQRKNGIDAPVSYTAEDSMTYEGATGIAHLYGNSHVKYQDMDL